MRLLRRGKRGDFSGARRAWPINKKLDDGRRVVSASGLKTYLSGVADSRKIGGLIRSLSKHSQELRKLSVCGIVDFRLPHGGRKGHGLDADLPDEFVDAVVRLHGQRYTGGPHPQWLSSTYDCVYRMILGSDICDEMKRRNPSPAYGSNHHQWLTPEARQKVEGQIGIVTALAETSGSKDEFWQRMRHKYAGEPMQMAMN